MLRRHLAVAAVVAVSALALAAPAGAAVTPKKSIWGPAEIGGVSQFPTYADLGVGIWQTQLSWADVAPGRPAAPRDPSDPMYRWPAGLDAAIADASAVGIEVSLMVSFAPRWANGGRDQRWAPKDPDDYADFLEATARRYPGIRYWLIWGEPTKAGNFKPLAADRGRALRGNALRGPRTYARLLDAAYGRLKRVSRSNVVVGGNTFTVGTVAPLRWVKALKLPSGRPPRMDMWGHNPFSLRSPDLSKPPLGNGYADFSDLDTLARALDRAMVRATVRRQRRLRIFISEFALPTDHPNVVFNFWVDRETQARWLTQALRITRRFDRIATFGYFQLFDPPERSDGQQAEWGLLERDGSKKPAYAAFKRG